MSAPDFTVVRATVADRPRIIAFLRAAFYKYEPINVAQGLADSPSPADIRYTLDNLHEGRSYLAIDGNTILGVAINGAMTDDEANHRKHLYETCQSADFKTFLKFWYHVERESDFWTTLGVTSAFSLDILAVDPNARGRGIGRTLVERSRGLAKEEGYAVFRMDCSSFYAAQLAEGVGMTCVWQLAYEDYRDDEGRVVFQVPAPHVAIKIYVQRL